ncbi:MAG: hypothetical protein IPN33_25000 [Saprospiraceae bacterium]|nr:hypothetical protein [Saprospiraceae bacterium]
MYEKEFESAGFEYTTHRGYRCWYKCINWLGIYGDCRFYSPYLSLKATLNVQITKLGVSVTYPAAELLEMEADKIESYCKTKIADAWRTAY